MDRLQHRSPVVQRVRRVPVMVFARCAEWGMRRIVVAWLCCFAVTAGVALCPSMVWARLSIDRIALSALPLDQLEAGLEQTYQRILDSGALNHSQYALVLIRASSQARAAQEHDRSVILAAYARKIAPDLPPVYLAEGLALWSRSKLSLHLLLGGYVKSVLCQTRNMESLCSTVTINLLVVVWALIGMLIVLSVMLLLKYIQLCYHDLRHVVSRNVPGGVLGIGLGLIFLLPVFLDFSAVWVCLYWLLLFYGYCARRERRIVTCVVGVFAFGVPMCIAAMVYTMSVPYAPDQKLLRQANYDYCDESCLAGLEALRSRDRDDNDVLFSLGLVHKREQNYRTATHYYRLVGGTALPRYSVLTNQGNVYLAQQLWDEATERYRKAIEAAPDKAAAAHFNFARAYQQKFLFKEAEQELVAAKQIDQDRIDWYLSIYSENANRLLIDEVLARMHLFGRAYRRLLEDRYAVADVWALYCNGMAPGWATLVLLIAWVLSRYYARLEKVRIATACSVCGRVVCKRCQVIITTEMLCSQCNHFLKKQDRLGFKQKEEKTAQVLQYVRRYKLITAVAGYLFPGAGHIWKGFSGRGVVLLFGFWVLVFKVGVLLFYEGPWDFAVSARPLEAVCAGLVLVAYWIVLQLDLRRLRSKQVEDNISLKSITAHS